jgi:hypothetical protein
MYIYIYMYIYMYVYMYICIYVYMYICIYVYMCICVYVYMCICVYVYMCICVYILLIYIYIIIMGFGVDPHAVLNNNINILWPRLSFNATSSDPAVARPECPGLPANIRCINSFSSFKTALKTYLFRLAIRSWIIYFSNILSCIYT